MTLRSIHEENRVLVQDNAKQVLYDNSGYGSPTGTKNEVVLSLVEALFLIEKEKISLPDGLSHEEFMERASNQQESFQEIYRVYGDLRERGYYLDHPPGEAKIKLYPRGEHPGKSKPTGYILPVSEHRTLSLDTLEEEPHLGVVDDDNDVTYFQCREWDGHGDLEPPRKRIKANRIGNRFYIEGDLESLPRNLVVTEIDGEAYLNPLEANYLRERDILDSLYTDINQETQTTYNKLRDKGFAVRSGFKFGFDFRLYNSSRVSRDKHSTHLVKAIALDEIDTNEISRLVRVAEGVKKTAVISLRETRFVSIERIRP